MKSFAKYFERAPKGLHRVRGPHQAGVIGGDADRERAGVPRDRHPLIGRKHEDALELVKRADAAPHLPAPVVPFGGGSVGIEVAIKGPRVAIDGEAECFLPGGCLDRYWCGMSL